MPGTFLCGVVERPPSTGKYFCVLLPNFTFGLGINIFYIFTVKPKFYGGIAMRKSFKRWVAITDTNFGPLGKYLEQFNARLSSLGYTHDSIKEKIRIARHLNKWLHQRKIKDLDEKFIRKFLRCYHKCHVNTPRNLRLLQDLLNWLREQDIVPKPMIVKRKGKFDRILRGYRGYLKNERGLAKATVKNYVSIASHFLSKRFRKGKILLKDLVATDITKFVFDQTKVYTHRRVQLITTALRSFFVYLRFHGDIKLDLAASVPTVADRSQAELPKYLPVEDINKLLRSCDQIKPVGIRDYALLTLMAHLGLRTREVFAMTLDDIDWETGIITIHGKGGYQEQLPIPKDVGRAIVTYLKKVRPKCNTRGLFVSTKAPIKELASSSICCIVRRACQRAGLSPPRQGVHLLRHSLATRMLREGSTMTEIATILRHRSPATTEIYAKVDLKSLREIAKPWPGEKI